STRCLLNGTVSLKFLRGFCLALDTGRRGPRVPRQLASKYCTLLCTVLCYNALSQTTSHGPHSSQVYPSSSPELSNNSR
ncbi:hypothetical protein EDD17DRAFT_1574540, partial [Pisolithus thermaeus]